MRLKENWDVALLEDEEEDTQADKFLTFVSKQGRIRDWDPLRHGNSWHPKHY